jgi:uncharacterized protein
MSNNPQPGLGIQEIIGDKRDAILDLASRYGASNVRVFGSVARGEADPDSDVDLLMQFPERTSIFDIVGLWQDLSHLLQREVDLLPDHPDGGPITQKARDESVPL